jgi:UDP-N-acetylmuramate--alanine ligase
MRHIHFIGIGGVGMSGLAQVMLSRGARVSGSDLHPNAATDRLAAQGATIYTAQVAENIAREEPDLVVYTAAIHEDNPELAAARKTGVEIISRAEFLGRLMAEFKGPRVAVAGTHGKTTTTAMLAEVLMNGGLDPTVLIGGDYAPFGGNTRVGHSDVFVTEACEAYDSFLALRPDITIITNVEADHLDHYGTVERVFEGFRRFAAQTSANGLLVYCADDPGARRLVEELLGEEGPRRRIAYGLESHGPDCLWAENTSESGGKLFAVKRRAAGHEAVRSFHVELVIPGLHNVRNALAAIAAGLEIGVPEKAITTGQLRFFGGVGRRFETLGEVNGVLVIDDYAHHPTEIRATLAAARAAYPERRVVVVFQPHLYSRTRDFMDEFAGALAQADAVLLTDIYAAREEPIEGVRMADLARRIAALAPDITLLYLPDKGDIPGALSWVTRPGDLALVMGAGDIREAGERFVAARNPAANGRK